MPISIIIALRTIVHSTAVFGVNKTRLDLIMSKRELHLKIPFVCLFLLIILSGCGKTNVSQALGPLERERIVLKATAAEIIIAEPIPEGSVVKKGDLF